LPLKIADKSFNVPDTVVLEEQIKDKLLTHLRDSNLPLTIIGEGGSGKTALAIAIARWLGQGLPSNVGGSRRIVLPILLEDDCDTRTALENLIKRSVEAAIGSSVSKTLALGLIERRRLCILFDGLSERSDATRSMVKDLIRSSRVPMILTTSRIADDIELFSGGSLNVSPERISGIHISTFLNRELIVRSQREMFDDPSFYELCTRMSGITKKIRNHATFCRVVFRN
jgi:hypothetical protein